MTGTRLGRLTFAFVFGSLIFVVAACGSGPNRINEAPPMPPTATPLPPQSLVDLEGEVLTPLANGREAASPDRRYALVLPSDWTPIDESVAEFAWRSRVGGHIYTVAREIRDDAAEPVQVWATSVRDAESDGVETLAWDPVQVNGIQAVRWVYIADASGERVLFHQVFLRDAGTGFILTGTSPSGSIDETIALFDSIAGTFSFPRG